MQTNFFRALASLSTPPHACQKEALITSSYRPSAQWPVRNDSIDENGAPANLDRASDAAAFLDERNALQMRIQASKTLSHVARFLLAIFLLFRRLDRFHPLVALAFRWRGEQESLSIRRRFDEKRVRSFFVGDVRFFETAIAYLCARSLSRRRT